MEPAPALVERFRVELDALSAPDERLGLAVSGGPDSVALLLLAVAARPGFVEASTIDHRLRPGSRHEAEMVADLCAGLGVPHEIRTLEWEEQPTSAVQERARDARYEALGTWVGRRGLSALATAHHADDQAETLIMRLNRGAGVRGLAGMRPKTVIPGGDLPLIRPLLGWRRAELEAICAAAGIESAADPSNCDEHYERVRVRQALAGAPWLDPSAVARSAAHLGAADDALVWMVEGLALTRIAEDGEALQIDSAGLPPELQRRLLLCAFARFHVPEPRGPDLARALALLCSGQTATLAGLKLEGGRSWRLTKAPPRNVVSDAH